MIKTMMIGERVSCSVCYSAELPICISVVGNLVFENGDGFIHKLIERSLIALWLLAFSGDCEKLDFCIQIIDLPLLVAFILSVFIKVCCVTVQVIVTGARLAERVQALAVNIPIAVRWASVWTVNVTR